MSLGTREDPATVKISRRDWGGQRGALLCRIPRWIEPILVEYAPEPSTALLLDEALLPTRRLRCRSLGFQELVESLLDKVTEQDEPAA